MPNTQPQVDPKMLKTKASSLKELLRTHHSVYVHLDSRKDRVLVPKNLRQPQLALHLGLNLPVPIKDLMIDDKGWHATLSFDRSPFTVFVPWDAVFAIVGDSGIGVQWEKDMPPEARLKREKSISTDAPPVPVQRDPEKHKNLPPGWRVIDGEKK